MKKSDIIYRIKKLRRMLCIHAYIYYTLGESLVEDSVWDGWALELVELQNNSTCAFTGYYDREFYDFDGSTGMHLPKDDFIKAVAEQLIKTHKEIK